MAEENEAARVQPERSANLLHLIDEAIELPERGLAGLIAEARPELIVVAAGRPRRALTSGLDPIWLFWPP